MGRTTRDLLCAVCLIVIAVAYHLVASNISRSALADEVGAAGLPHVYARLLAVVGLMIGAQALIRLRLGHDAPVEGGTEEPAVGMLVKRAGGTLAIGIAYLLLVPWVGYVVGIAAAIAAMLLYQGERASVHAGLVAIGGAVLFWLLFVQLLGIAMPAIGSR